MSKIELKSQSMARIENDLKVHFAKTSYFKDRASARNSEVLGLR